MPPNLDGCGSEVLRRSQAGGHKGIRVCGCWGGWTIPFLVELTLPDKSAASSASQMAMNTTMNCSWGEDTCNG